MEIDTESLRRPHLNTKHMKCQDTEEWIQQPHLKMESRVSVRYARDGTSLYQAVSISKRFA